MSGPKVRKCTWCLLNAPKCLLSSWQGSSCHPCFACPSQKDIKGKKGGEKCSTKILDWPPRCLCASVSPHCPFSSQRFPCHLPPAPRFCHFSWHKFLGFQKLKWHRTTKYHLVIITHSAKNSRFFYIIQYSRYFRFLFKSIQRMKWYPVICETKWAPCNDYITAASLH